MAKKKPDPISDKARSLEAEIAALEAEIKKLGTQLEKPAGPKFRSTATPSGATIPHAPEKIEKKLSPPKSAEPVFEELKRSPLSASASEPPEIYNELGVRKYDLPALWNRVRNHFRGPTTSNPRLVNYLAAGGVQGLRPLRYEKRVARNRFIVFAAVLFVILLGLIFAFVRNFR